MVYPGCDWPQSPQTVLLFRVIYINSIVASWHFNLWSMKTFISKHSSSQLDRNTVDVLDQCSLLRIQCECCSLAWFVRTVELRCQMRVQRLSLVSNQVLNKRVTDQGMVDFIISAYLHIHAGEVEVSF